MPGRSDRELDVAGVLHANRLFARLEWFGTVGREVFRGIGRIDRFDEKVLGVRVGGGEPPCDRVVLTQQDAGRSRHGAALDPAVRRDDAGEIPEDRRLKP